MGIVETLSEWSTPVRDYVNSSPILATILIILLYLLIASLVHYVLKHWVRTFLKRTKSRVADKILSKIQNPLAFLIVLAGIFVGLERIIIGDALIVSVVESMIILVVTYVVVIIADIILDFWGHNFTNKKGEEFHDEVLPLTKGTTRLIFGIVGFLFLLDSWGVEIVPLLASLGIAGVVLGLALQDTMKNIFGGISLIVDKDFHIGDVIKLDDGQEGEVVEITLRSTKIRNYDNEVVIIPNALLSTTKFINYAKPTNTVRLVIDVALAYGTDPHKAEEVLLGALRNNPKILKYPKRVVRFEKMSDYSLNYKVMFFIADYHERFTIKDQVTKDIYDALYREKLQIPFPTRTIMEGESINYRPKKAKK